MHSKQCYEICISSVILGQLEPFIMKVRIFLIPDSPSHFLILRILGFLFSTKKSPYLGNET